MIIKKADIIKTSSAGHNAERSLHISLANKNCMEVFKINKQEEMLPILPKIFVEKENVDDSINKRKQSSFSQFREKSNLLDVVK